MRKLQKLLRSLTESEEEITYIPEGSDIGSNVRSQTFPEDLMNEAGRLIKTMSDLHWQGSVLYVGFLGSATAHGPDYDIHLQTRAVKPSEVFDSRGHAINTMRSAIELQNSIPSPENQPKTMYFATILAVKDGQVLPGNAMTRVLTNGQVTNNLELFGPVVAPE